MRIAFRVDVSPSIGSGHIMRCLALAESLKALKVECLFLSRDYCDTPKNLFDDSGHRLRLLRIPENLGVDIRTKLPKAKAEFYYQIDAKLTLEALDEEKSDLLIVDHYGLDLRWETLIFGRENRLMVIDDLANRPHRCSIILNQNPGRSLCDYDGLVPRDCRVLAGAGFAMLRPDFKHFRRALNTRTTDSFSGNLLISMGSADKENITAIVLGVLSDDKQPFIGKISVILGRLSPNIKHVRDICRNMPIQTELIVEPSNIAELMATSDYAISNCGVTSLELCCLGVPSIACVVADNQLPTAKFMRENKCAIVIENNDYLDISLRQALYIMRSRAVRRNISARSSMVTDGEGAERVAAIIHRELQH